MYGIHTGSLNVSLVSIDERRLIDEVWILRGDQGDLWRRVQVAIESTEMFRVCWIFKKIG